MKTIVKKTVVTKLDDVALFRFDKATEECTDIHMGNLQEMAAELKCSPELLETLVNFADYLKDMLGEDLRDIWSKL